MWTADNWRDYEIIDASGGEKLERWGKYILIRPDPQIIWHTPKTAPQWQQYHGHYTRSSSGGGEWDVSRMPEQWNVSYRDLSFIIKPLGFKHTGLFPEQAQNWDWLSDKIKKAGRPINLLNLFAYTGGATVAAASAGASVCHVDAARGMVAWARDNARINGLENAPIRYIIDDCQKFAQREIRRGKKYDAIIMDPPSYGRGPNGEIWKIEEQIYTFVELCLELLSDKPLFVLINSYTTGLAPSVLTYILGVLIKTRLGGRVTGDEIGLPVTSTSLLLPCGASGRWESGI